MHKIWLKATQSGKDHILEIFSKEWLQKKSKEMQLTRTRYFPQSSWMTKCIKQLQIKETLNIHKTCNKNQSSKLNFQWMKCLKTFPTLLPQNLAKILQTNSHKTLIFIKYQHPETEWNKIQPQSKINLKIIFHRYNFTNLNLQRQIMKPN